MSTFHCFPRLPAEIQLLIWEAFAQVPRVVQLEYGQHIPMNRTNGIAPDHYPEHHTWFSPTPSPAIHRVCRDARAVAQRYYRKSFCCSHPSHLEERFVLFNFNTDVIQMDITQAIQYKRSDFDWIQKLQLMCPDELAAEEFRAVRQNYFNFDAVESLDIIHNGSMEPWMYWAEGMWCHIFENFNGDVIRVINIETGDALDIQRGGWNAHVAVRYRIPVEQARSRISA